MRTDSLAKAFASTRGILANVKPGQLDNPTSCVSWNVRDLINHVITAPRWAAARINAGDEATIGGEDYATGDVLASYDETARAALGAFRSPGALEKTVKLRVGEFPGAFLMGMVTTDQFVHGWDLARATGQATDLDAELASELLAQAREGISDAFRGPDGVAPFGPAVEAPPGAGPADQLAAFLGRSV